VPLAGGRIARGIARVGDTVRRPMPANSDYVHGLLAHLERSGFDGAPRFLGVDSRRREDVSYIEGTTLPHKGFRLSREAVAAGARLVRRVHDLTAGTEFAPGSQVACHLNLSQPNFVCRDMIPIAIIDWDVTRPGSRSANLADPLGVRPPSRVRRRRGRRDAARGRRRVQWTSGGLVDAMLTTVRAFVELNPRVPRLGTPGARTPRAQRQPVPQAPERMRSPARAAV
jgi:hypothetical protein